MKVFLWMKIYCKMYRNSRFIYPFNDSFPQLPPNQDVKASKTAENHIFLNKFSSRGKLSFLYFISSILIHYKYIWHYWICDSKCQVLD